MDQTVDPGISFSLAVLLGVVLVLLFLGLLVVIVRVAMRKPAHKPPLIPSKDGHYEVVGERVTCFHCGEARFKAQEILLNTWFLSLLRIDWLDSSATVLTCDTCGRLTWFAQEDPSDK